MFLPLSADRGSEGERQDMVLSSALLGCSPLSLAHEALPLPPLRAPRWCLASSGGGVFFRLPESSAGASLRRPLVACFVDPSGPYGVGHHSLYFFLAETASLLLRQPLWQAPRWRCGGCARQARRNLEM
jgi:hypothetical protein